MLLESFLDCGWIFPCVVAAIGIAVFFMLRSNPLVEDLSGRFVLITGCDTGFGNLLARELDRNGVNVFAACFTHQGEYSLQKSCSKRLITLRLDVTKHEQIEDALQLVKKALPPGKGLWGLVNNAGIVYPGPFDWTPVKIMRDIMDVNLWGAVSMTKAFLPLLKQSQGRVVNVSSCLGLISMPNLASYCMSKFALRSFSDSLRRELKPWRVSVHVIEPGFFKTGVSDTANNMKKLQYLWENLDGDMKESYGTTFYEKAVRRLSKLELMASCNTSAVVDSMFHALFASRPKVHYPVGWDTQLLYRWLGLLPACIVDKVLRAKATPAKAP